MESIEVSAKTVEDAVLEAAIKLGTTRDKIDYEVITQPTSGFLGIGAKKAVIRAHQISDAEVEAKQKAEKEMEKLLKRVNEKKPEEKPAEPVKKAETLRKEEKAPEIKKTAEIKKEAPKKEDKKEEVPAVKSEKPEKPVAPVDTAPVEKFLKDVFHAMGMEVTVAITQNPKDREMNITLDGADMGVLIGKRGQTLDSLQYLTSLVVNKNAGDYIRVKVDTENYRERRKATLENLARNIAQKVKRSGKQVSLEPMNPYERRVIHSALQNDKFVCTHSEGEEPYRRVVVTLKEGVKVENYGNRNRGRYNRNYNRKKER